MTKKTRKISRAVAAIGISAVCFLGGMASVWFTLDPEIRALVKVKKTIDAHYYREIDDDSFYKGVFDSVNAQLDPYSGYMSADTYTQSANELNGNRIGIGVSFYNSSLEEGRLEIARVAGNSPAEKAGLTAGSCITGFGKGEETLVTSNDYAQFTSFLKTLEEGEPFLLAVRTGEETEFVTLTQEAYVENYVFYRSKDSAYGFTGPRAATLTAQDRALTCLPDDTAYIRLVRFGGNAVEAFEGGMSVFKRENKKNLILDLRGNGGGYINAMQSIASYFCKSSDALYPVAAIADYGEREEHFLARGNVYGEYFSADSRICILADGGSASAAECLIGVMVDYGASAYGDICLFEKNGVAKTYGKGIMQSHFPISASGDSLKLTTAEVRWPMTKRSIHGRGILPEDGAKIAREGENEEEELRAAIELLFG